MKKLILVLFFITLSSLTKASVWTVEPNECLVTNIEEFCETNLIFTLENEVGTEYCIFEGQQKIGCFLPSMRTIVVKRKIDRTLTFTLVDNQQDIVDSVDVELTILQAQRKRRRVKLPWNIF